MGWGRSAGWRRTVGDTAIAGVIVSVAGLSQTEEGRDAATNGARRSFPRPGDGQHDGPRRRRVRAGPQGGATTAGPGPAHRGARRAATAGPGAAAQAVQRAARPGSALLGRRPGLRHRVPHPGDRAAAARLGGSAHRAGCPAARAPAGPQPPAVGDLLDHRPGQAPLCGVHEDPPLRDRRPVRPPGLVTIATLAAARLAIRPVQSVRIANEMVRVLPTLAPSIGTLVGGALGLNRGDGEVIPTTAGRAPSTPFNRPITPHRRVAFRSVELDVVKAVKNAYGVSVNDVVLAVCAGALRHWLK